MAVSDVDVSAPRFGTGTDKGGRETFVLCPAAPETIAAEATTAVFSVVIPNGVGEELRKKRTTAAVVLASVATRERLSMTAPSLPRQSTSTVQPPPRMLARLACDDRAGVAPRVANS